MKKWKRSDASWEVLQQFEPIAPRSPLDREISMNVRHMKEPKTEVTDVHKYSELSKTNIYLKSIFSEFS